MLVPRFATKTPTTKMVSPVTMVATPRTRRTLIRNVAETPGHKAVSLTAFPLANGYCTEPARGRGGFAGQRVCRK